MILWLSLSIPFLLIVCGSLEARMVWMVPKGSRQTASVTDGDRDSWLGIWLDSLLPHHSSRPLFLIPLYFSIICSLMTMTRCSWYACRRLGTPYCRLNYQSTTESTMAKLWIISLQTTMYEHRKKHASSLFVSGGLGISDHLFLDDGCLFPSPCPCRKVIFDSEDTC